MSSLTFAPLSSFSEYSAAPCDRVMHFDGGGMPAEIAALGQAERVYEPNQIAYKLAGWRHLLAFLVVAVIGGLISLVFVGLAQKNQLDQLADPTVWLVFGIIGATALGVAFWLTRLKPTTATVFFYRQAAVIAERNRLTLIPWQHLLWLPGRIFTDEGLEFRCGWMEDHDEFEEAIWERSAELWAPAALKKVRAGETVTAGDLAISATHLSCQGKTAAWDEVTSLVVVVGRVYELSVFTSASSWIRWAEVNLHQVPNARAMQQLIASVAPSHLLQPAE